MELRQRLRELSAERRRFGYRRLHILLKRAGWEVNWIGARQAVDPGDRL
jgi:putative transposase